MLINCDWFSFSVLLALSEDELRHGCIFSCPVGYSLVELQGTNIYKRRVIVVREDGTKYLTLLLEPHNIRINKPNSCFVEVANPFLYADYSDVLDFLFTLHSYSFQSVSRFDIACDFNPTLEQQHIIAGLADMSYYVSSKRDGSMFCNYKSSVIDTKAIIRRQPRSISWGSKYSNIRWKLYNKRDEIMEIAPSGLPHCKKPYIMDAWLAADMDISDVWRLEVSIVGASKFEWHGEKLTFENCSTPESFFYLFCSLYHSRFKVRLNGQKTNHRYDETVMFLDLPIEKDGSFSPRVGIPSSMIYPVEMASVLKAMVSQLSKPEVVSNRPVFMSISSSVKDIVSMCRLSSYFFQTYGLTYNEFDEFVNNGSLMLEDRFAFVQDHFNPKVTM